MPNERLRLQNKVAIVTGAGSSGSVMGNGRAAAILFAREGAKVLAVDISEERVSATVDAIKAEGFESEYFVGDVSDSKDCVKMVERADYNFGTIDILHNNVGISGPGSILDVDEKEWSYLMQINVTSMMLTAKAAVPKMIKSGGGCIINIASISAIRPKGRTPYAVSKAAVVGLTRAMAVDHGKDHIRVNCILPGPAYTSMVAGGMSDAQRTIRREASPLNLEGNSWDIAWAAVYLASEEARWVTGAELVVDGGISLQSPRG